MDKCVVYKDSTARIYMSPSVLELLGELQEPFNMDLVEFIKK
jgi:hypothetical protein